MLMLHEIGLCCESVTEDVLGASPIRLSLALDAPRSASSWWRAPQGAQNWKRLRAAVVASEKEWVSTAWLSYLALRGGLIGIELEEVVEPINRLIERLGYHRTRIIAEIKRCCAVVLMCQVQLHQRGVVLASFRH